MYPKTNCVAVTEDYIGESATFTYDKWIEHSFVEYLQQKNLRETDQPTMYTKIYQCFCRYEDSQGVGNDKTYSDGEQILPICQQYFDDQVNSLSADD